MINPSKKALAEDLAKRFTKKQLAEELVECRRESVTSLTGNMRAHEIILQMRFGGLATVNTALDMLDMAFETCPASLDPSLVAISKILERVKFFLSLEGEKPREFNESIP